MIIPRPKAYDQEMIDKISEDKVCRDSKEVREFIALIGDHHRYKKYVDETYEHYYKLFSKKQDDYNYNMMMKYHKEVQYMQNEELRLKKIDYTKQRRLYK